MHIVLDSTPAAWNAAIERFPEANFLQSWQWGVFQASLGKTVVRIMWLDAERVVALAQLVVESARRGRYAALAGGPLLDWSNPDRCRAVFAEIVSQASARGCSFIRFRPQREVDQIDQAVLASIHARLAPMHLTADLTIQIDLTQSDDQLLMAMRKQHRQAIKKAESLGVEVTISENPSDIDQFYQRQLEVAERQHFVPFAKDFLKQQFEQFVPDGHAALFQAKKGTTLLAEAFVLFYNGEAVYHYGNSTDANREFPGSYACQWAVIQEARRRQCHTYNLWGVSPKDDHRHRFYGVGLFKRGFGGREVQYLPAHDIPLSASYWFTWIFEQLRRRARKL